ncbi:hypothetical protein DL95DRAFT_521685 [Leptodontidium sp. 2 PMI_412]|nr:hypothetical protein DL95DRAFT_521685 [Leptodontidium sp. 2 PMI_412]
MAARLKSRCAGLLEVSQEVDRECGPNVSFLHRPVKDFLSMPDTQRLLKRWAPQDFDVPNCLLKACILSLRTATANVNDGDFGPIYYSAQKALTIAHRARNSSHGLNNQLVDALDETVTGYWNLIPISNKDQHWADWRARRKPRKERRDFLIEAIAHGLVEYVAAKLLENDQQIVWKTGRPYLEYALRRNHDIAGQLEMTIVLLGGGANPNKMYDGHTFWQYILEQMSEVEEKPGSIFLRIGPPHFSSGCPLYEPWISALKMLIEAGAKPNQLCLYQTEYKYHDNLMSTYNLCAFTPLHMFSSLGLFPNVELQAALRSRGAVALWEVREYWVNTNNSERGNTNKKEFLSEMNSKLQKLVKSTNKKRSSDVNRGNLLDDVGSKDSSKHLLAKETTRCAA